MDIRRLIPRRWRRSGRARFDVLVECQPGRDGALIKAIIDHVGRGRERELGIAPLFATERIPEITGLHVTFLSAARDAESARSEATSLAAHIQKVNGAPCTVVVDVSP